MTEGSRNEGVGAVCSVETERRASAREATADACRFCLLDVLTRRCLLTC